MAEITLQTKIDQAEAAKGLKDLRKALKDLVSAQSEVGSGTKEFKKLQEAINSTEGKIGDLNDSFSTLKGSGVERLNGSLGLLREGFASADPGKLSIGMEGLGAAMKALPIFLVIEGAKLLFENFDKLSAMFSETEKQARANERALKDLTNQIDLQNASIDRNLIGLEAQLNNLKRQEAPYQVIIEKMKEIDGLKTDQFVGELQKANKEIANLLAKLREAKEDRANASETESFLQFLGFNAGTTDEEIRELEDQLVKLQVKQTEIGNKKISSEAQTTAAIEDIRNKANEEAKKREQEELARQVAAYNRLAELENEKIDKAEAQKVKDKEEGDKLFNELAAAEDKRVEDSIKKKEHAVEVERAFEEKAVNERIRLAHLEYDEKQKLAAQELAEHKKAQELKLKATQQGLAAAKSISDFYFATQLNKVKGNADQELKVKKKQFEVEKGLRIANIAIDTASAVVKTVAELGGVGALTPAGIALIGGITALGIASAATVAVTKFDGGTGPEAPATLSAGGAESSSGGVPAAQNNVPVAFNPNATLTGNQRTTNSNGAIKVVVLENDIREVANKVDVLESRATFAA